MSCVGRRPHAAVAKTNRTKKEEIGNIDGELKTIQRELDEARATYEDAIESRGRTISELEPELQEYWGARFDGDQKVRRRLRGKHAGAAGRTPPSVAPTQRMARTVIS